MLPVRDHMALTLAAAHYKHSGSLESAVRDQLGMSFPQFCRHVSMLLRDPEAEAELPTLVHRLRRLEDARREVRSRRVDARSSRPAPRSA